MKVDPQPDLRPRPLCGGVAFLKTNTDVNYEPYVNRHNAQSQFWIKCDSLDCGVTLDSLPDQKQIVQRWNRRAVLPVH